MADFLSHMENHLPEEEVEEALRRVEISGSWSYSHVRQCRYSNCRESRGGHNVLPIRACLVETLSACPVKYTTLQVVDWKKAQREDPALNTLVKNLRSSKEDFMRAMCKVPQPQGCSSL